MKNNTWKDIIWISLQKIAPQHLISRLAGLIADHHIPWLTQFLIKQFIARFQVDMSIAERSSPKDYSTFNDFFTRKLVEGVREILPGTMLASPVDGTVAQIGHVESGNLIQAKQHQYSSHALLADQALAGQFEHGLFTTLYLSPKDYHRIHMPIDGKLVMMRYIPGSLYSVNQKTQENIPDLFAKNERLVCHFQTELGDMCLVLVGAMIVGSIATEWAGIIAPSRVDVIQSWHYPQPIAFKQGEEIGHFRLGSTVIMLLSPRSGRQWASNLEPETSVTMGQVLS